jgi:hypothetical protein
MRFDKLERQHDNTRPDNHSVAMYRAYKKREHDLLHNPSKRLDVAGKPNQDANTKGSPAGLALSRPKDVRAARISTTARNENQALCVSAHLDNRILLDTA